SRSCRVPARLARARISPVVEQTEAQSRLRRTHATSRSIWLSDRHASAHAVHASTAQKHASMQRLIASLCAGWAGCERNIARTTEAVIWGFLLGLFAARVGNPGSAFWFRAGGLRLLLHRFQAPSWRQTAQKYRRGPSANR